MTITNKLSLVINHDKTKHTHTYRETQRKRESVNGSLARSSNSFTSSIIMVKFHYDMALRTQA